MNVLKKSLLVFTILLLGVNEAWAMEDKLPYSTVLIKSHYTPEIETIHKKKQAKEILTSAEETMLKDSKATGGTGFFYIDKLSINKELKINKNIFSKFLFELFGVGDVGKAQNLMLQRDKFIEILTTQSAFHDGDSWCECRDSKFFKIFKDLKNGESSSFNALFSYPCLNSLSSLCDQEIEVKELLMEGVINNISNRSLSLRQQCYFNNTFADELVYSTRDTSQLYVITNRHILLGKDSKSPEKSKTLVFDFKDSLTSFRQIRIECKEGQNTFYHPEYDICIINVSKEFEQEIWLHYYAFTQENIPYAYNNQDFSFLVKASIKKHLSVTSPVYMTGYPRAIYDKHNHLPVTRGGTIASPIDVMWNNKHEFLTDITVFKGSSGSPIFYLYKPLIVKYDTISVISRVDPYIDDVMGFTSDKEEGKKVEALVSLNETEDEVVESIKDEISQKATKINLLGLLRSSPMFTFKSINGSVRVPMGLGIVVKSHILIGFLKDIYKEKYNHLDIETFKQQQLLNEEEETDYSDYGEDLGIL